MNKWQILITDVAWPSLAPEAEVLAKIGGEVILAETGSEEELLRLVPTADAIMTNWAQVPVSVVRSGKNIQVISRYGIGVDNIPVEEATRYGIIVTNVPTYCLDEVSDHAMALILACARKVCQYHAQVRAGNWEVKSCGPVFRVRGKILGLLGFGKIARALVDKARAFGLHILVYDPFIPQETIQAYQCEAVELDDLFMKADFISIHTSLTTTTQCLVDAIRLEKMKPTAYLINTSRGKVIDQAALVAALTQGRIAGAALDVYSPEPLASDHPLLSMPNVISTPHVSFYSEESLLDLEVQAAENVAAVLTGKCPGQVVNPQVLQLPRWDHLR
jgi:D-3-phosphoglycerate dehydrogenase